MSDNHGQVSPAGDRWLPGRAGESSSDSLLPSAILAVHWDALLLLQQGTFEQGVGKQLELKAGVYTDLQPHAAANNF